MRSLIVVSVLLLIASLTALFAAAARAIYRDLDTRFERIRARLEHEATALLRGRILK